MTSDRGDERASVASPFERASPESCDNSMNAIHLEADFVLRGAVEHGDLALELVELGALVHDFKPPRGLDNALTNSLRSAGVTNATKQ
jgi:hypothetical protein